MHAPSLLALLSALPLSQAANLLTNGNFESGTWGKWAQQAGNQSAYQSVVSPGHGSQYAGAHVVTARDGSLIANYPTVRKLTVGVQYKWTVDYKLNNAGCTTEFGNTEGTLLLFGGSGVPVKIGAWATYHGTFFALQGNESLQLATYCNVLPAKPSPDGPVAQFDNFVLEPVSDEVYTTASPPTGPNLVVDPNLESGTLKAYNISQTSTSSVRVASPGYNRAAHSINITEVAAGPPDSFALILQNLEGVKKDTVYRVSSAIRILKKEPQLCYIETYIQQTGFAGSTDVSSTVPFQTAYDFPPASQIIPPIGTWRVYSGLVSGIANSFEIGMTAACLTGTAEFEVGDIQVVPLS